MMTIRRKLLIQISSIMLLFILLLIIANSFFLESIYINGTKSNIIDMYHQINQLEQEQITSQSLYNYIINSRTFIDLVVVDEANQRFILPINPQVSEMDSTALIGQIKPPPIAYVDVISKESIDDQTTLLQATDKRNDSTFFSLIGHLDNGFRIEIRVPLKSISENVSFFNQFVLVTGTVILVITFIAANFIAKHFTRPIQNMSIITKRIKDLDFDASCDVSTNDEMGQLAEHINEMSYTLRDNIVSLESSNVHLQEEIQERLRIDQQRKALLNNVSHELKTPLSLIQGYSEGLKINLHKKPEKVDFYCDVIIDEATKMDVLVSQLLDINHIQFGDFPLHKEIIQGKDFIDYILQKQQPLLEAAHIDLSRQLDVFETYPELSLHIDALRTEQILTNLINNAIAYAESPYHLNIEAIITKNSDEESDNLSNKHINSDSDNHLRLIVSNSYQPVDQQELKNWWNSFYKVDKARTRENGGYGLGLSIIKAIQEADNNSYGVFYDKEQIHFYVDLDIETLD